jgi:hypothetical protein
MVVQAYSQGSWLQKWDQQQLVAVHHESELRAGISGLCMNTLGIPSIAIINTVERIFQTCKLRM